MRFLPVQMMQAPVALVRRAQRVVESTTVRHRRQAFETQPGLAYLSVRAVHRPDGVQVVRAVEEALHAVRGVHWARVLPFLGIVVVGFQDGEIESDDLVAVIELVERNAGVDQEEFPELPGHPADPAPIRRGVTALMADAVGVGIGGVTRLLRLPRLPVEIASAIPAVDSIPRVRGLLDGRPGLEMSTALVNAVLQGLGQGPVGLIVDVAHRAALVTELTARRRVWTANEHVLLGYSGSESPQPRELAERPLPLPPGLVERYGQGVSQATLASGAFTLALTADPRRAADVLLAGLPRAARLGRDGFGAQVGRALSSRDVIAMDPRVFRLLDRIDTVVLDADALLTGQWVLGDVKLLGSHATGSEDAQVLQRVAGNMFDPALPMTTAHHDSWTLCPIDEAKGRWPRGSRGRSERLGRNGTEVLALSRDGVVIALFPVLPEIHAATGSVVAAARRCGHRLVAARSRNGLSGLFDHDRVVPGGTRLASAVRNLQSEGRGVALVSNAAHAALQVADCGIGITGLQGGDVPWGADLISLHLADVAPILEATRLAKTASRQAVALAAVGSTAASLFALSPLPGAGRRAVTSVQLATLAAIGAGTWVGAQLPPSPPRREQPAVAWHSLEGRDVLSRLDTGPGSTPAGALAPATHEDVSLIRTFPSVLGSELINPLSLILGAGAGLSAAVGSVVDAGLIAGVLGIDALLGAAQRLRTEAAIGRLASAISEGTVQVIRNGSEVEVTGHAVVPGDILKLSAGDAIPADGRLLEAVGLEIDESSLTGESLPVAKGEAPVASGRAVADRTSMIYGGTAVAAGQGQAVIVATGEETEARRGSQDMSTPATGVEHRLRSLTDKTIPVVLAAGGVLTLNGFMRGRPVREAVASGVSLAAAAVPEGLPFVATVAQASAAQRLSERGVLVRNPEVLEALGRIDTLCFDKTGTLTEGSLQVRRVSDGRVDEPLTALRAGRRSVLAAALRATPRARSRSLPHPTDQAIVDAGASAHVRSTFGKQGWKKLGSLPFEPGRAYHAVLGKVNSRCLISVKGAPEVVLPRCRSFWRDGRQHPLDSSALTSAESEVDRLARQGLRVLAVAERSTSNGNSLEDDRIDRLELLGFVGVADPTRPTAVALLEQLWRANINVVMVTGDHPSTAEAIASDLELLNGRRVVTGAELDQLDDRQLDEIVDDVAVFARVTPADKVRIVSAFQRAGRVVAMTGDGANDAQAIRLADIGVAFGPHATSAARDSADLVVAHDDVSVLIETIAECRSMWASVREALAILLGGNLGEVVFTTGASLLTGRPPLTPRQLLAVNLFTDLAPAMAIAVQPSQVDKIDLAREGPETSLAGPLVRDITIRAGATASATYAGWIAARLTGTPTRARTVALATLVGTQLGQTLVIGRRSPLVVGTAVGSAAGLLAMIQVPGVSRFFDCRPLGPVGWGIVSTTATVGTLSAIAANAVSR